jgi:hypothetical protein
VDNNESRGGFGEMTIYKQRFIDGTFFLWMIVTGTWSISYGHGS